MVKINYLSDLHLEFFKKTFDFSKIFNFNNSGEILCLCGDIGYPEEEIYEKFLTFCSNKFKHIFLISGNHEYYSKENNKTIQSTNKIIEEVCNKFSNIYFMNNKMKYLSEYNLNIIGSTLWTELPEDILDHGSKKFYNDFNMIYYKYENGIYRLNEDYINLLNAESLEFIEESLKSINNESKTIILTHHLPTYKIISDKYKDYKFNYFFANNLDELIKK
jgi:predicted MPP superfamily phosphohydrolase